MYKKTRIKCPLLELTSGGKITIEFKTKSFGMPRCQWTPHFKHYYMRLY